MATPDEGPPLYNVCSHPSIMAEIFGPNGGHYGGVPLYMKLMILLLIYHYVDFLVIPFSVWPSYQLRLLSYPESC